MVGAGSHTAEISGSTIAYTEQVLPIKNLPILKLAQGDEVLPAGEMAQRIGEKLNWHRLEDDTPQIALAIKGLKNPSFLDIQRYAEGIVKGLQDLIDQGIPLVVMVDQDMAKALGHSLFAQLPPSILLFVWILSGWKMGTTSTSGCP